MNKNTVILMVAVAVISAGLTRYYFPQIEIKNTETIKEVVRNDIRTIVKEVVRPDGSKETITETTDKSTKKETSKSELIVAAKNQWMVDIAARKTLSDSEIYYDLQIQRRILGPFFAGIKASTDKSVGVSIGMEF
jgi:Na+-translocating ferredoxin:NAD+ oxidoreductase RnfG subunit